MQATDYQRLLQQFPVVRDYEFQSRNHIRPVRHQQIHSHQVTAPVEVIASQVPPATPSTTVPSSEDDTDTMHVIIKSLKGQEYTLKVRPQDRISQLKELVQAESAVPVDRQRLILKGKALNDDESIQQAGITDGTKIHLTLRAAPKSATGAPGTTDASPTLPPPPQHVVPPPSVLPAATVAVAPQTPGQERAGAGVLAAEAAVARVPEAPMSVPDRFWESLHGHLCKYLSPTVASSVVGDLRHEFCPPQP